MSSSTYFKIFQRYKKFLIPKTEKIDYVSIQNVRYSSFKTASLKNLEGTKYHGGRQVSCYALSL